MSQTGGRGAGMGLAQVTARAVTPDQLLPYVEAVSGLQTRMFGSCVGHFCEGQVVLIGYPLDDPRDTASMDAAVAEALRMPGLEHITVLGPARPANVPAGAQVSEDAYWTLPLPLPPAGQKLRNMLRRAARDIVVTSGGAEAWGPEHSALVEAFCAGRTLDAGMLHIFRQLEGYLARARESRLFSARLADGTLVACALGDYSAFGTAFYMFAFRLPSAPPGTADALLAAVAAEGEARGHSVLNLGLGINGGISFFKKKWGASLFLPCVECGWDVRQEKKSWLARLLGR
ncbi:MAG: translation initiation factor IF-2 [Desulfovibrionaceae bacterium]|nr:translation initiation factor IF-2 [Desulfovibrionaceae bacterium]